jgi:hypothetical protein
MPWGMIYVIYRGIGDVGINPFGWGNRIRREKPIFSDREDPGPYFTKRIPKKKF